MAQFTAVAQAVPVKAVPVAVGDQNSMAMPMPMPMPAETVGVNPLFGYPAAKAMLMSEYGWPVGLANSILKSMSTTPYRVFLIDDSGSMGRCDGNMLYHSQQGAAKVTKVTCTRWTELVQCIKFHAKLAHIAQAPSEFRLLNAGNPVELGTPATMDGTNLQILFSLLDGQPGGGTPLCFHIDQVVHRVTAMNHTLRQNRQKLSFTIFTDGESSDGDIASALRPLERLPVWTVVRLCTDEDNIVRYWNNIDDNLELEMDVLDDLFGEREEVVAHNPWINYCEPLHRLREFGSHFKCMDLLDESKLKGDHLRDTLSILLGGEPNSFPHPDVDPKALQAHVEMLLRDTPLVMDPKHLKMKPIIKVHRLGPSSGCVLQ